MLAGFLDGGGAKTVVDQLLAGRAALLAGRHSKDIENIQSLRAAALGLLNDRGESVFHTPDEASHEALPRELTSGMWPSVVDLSDKWLEVRWLAFESYALQFSGRYRRHPGRSWETLHSRYRRVMRRLDQLERRR